MNNCSNRRLTLLSILFSGFGPKGDMDVQVLRSSSDWSHGILTEPSIQNAYCQLINEATSYIYIENQVCFLLLHPTSLNIAADAASCLLSVLCVVPW